VSCSWRGPSGHQSGELAHLSPLRRRLLSHALARLCCVYTGWEVGVAALQGCCVLCRVCVCVCVCVVPKIDTGILVLRVSCVCRGVSRAGASTSCLSASVFAQCEQQLPSSWRRSWPAHRDRDTVRQVCGCLWVCVCVRAFHPLVVRCCFCWCGGDDIRLTNIAPPSRTDRSPRAPLGAAVDPNRLKGCGAAERSHLRAALLPRARTLSTKRVPTKSTGTADRRCCVGAVQTVSGSRCAKRPAVACADRVPPPLCCR
jgi:hypothetical protein